MRNYLLIIIVCLLSACAPSPVKQVGLDGQTHEIEGYGFATKDSVHLYKNIVVNNAIGGCIGMFGIESSPDFDARCNSMYLGQQIVDLRFIQRGQHMNIAMRQNPVLGSGQYGHGKEIVITTPARMPQTQPEEGCYFLASRTGNPIPIRSGEGMGRHLFTLPLYEDQNMREGRKATIVHYEAELLKAKNYVASATPMLQRNPAYQNGQCITPTQQPIPPKPQTMSMEEAQFQADGACFDMIASRHKMDLAMNSMGAIGRRDVIKTHREWVQESPAACSRVEMTQINNLLCDVGGVFSPHIARGCLQNFMDECTGKVLRSCAAPLLAWENKARAIQAAPQQQRQQCEEIVGNLVQQQSLIPRYSQAIEQLKVQERADPTTQQDLYDMVDLNEATCSF